MKTKIQALNWDTQQQVLIEYDTDDVHEYDNRLSRGKFYQNSWGRKVSLKDGSLHLERNGTHISGLNLYFPIN